MGRIKSRDIVALKGEAIAYEQDGLGDSFKKPVIERAKKSKFAQLLKTMSDQEIQALGYCLLISKNVRIALECYRSAVEHGVQIYALEQEYKKRKTRKLEAPR
jgi:hypothetical protein